MKGENSDLILKRAIEYTPRSLPSASMVRRKNVAALIDSGLVKALPDSLSAHCPQQVARLERFAELSAQNLVEIHPGFQTLHSTKFITALGIRHVGAQTAATLSPAPSRILMNWRPQLQKTSKTPRHWQNCHQNPFSLILPTGTTSKCSPS